MSRTGSRSARVVPVMTPTRRGRPLIDPADQHSAPHHAAHQLIAGGEGMTGSPYPACPPPRTNPRP